MIFVTVGTHEQPFDRLIKEIDRLKGTGKIDDHIFIQTGYSTYNPHFCKYKRFIAFEEMVEMIGKARIIITHGGPGSIMPCIYKGKIPIVVPRQKKFKEVVDNHQLSFCRKIEEKGKIIVVYEIEELEQKIRNFDDLKNKLWEKLKENGFEAKVKNFAEAIEAICQEIIRKKKKI